MMWLHAVFKPSSSRGFKRGENQNTQVHGSRDGREYFSDVFLFLLLLYNIYILINAVFSLLNRLSLRHRRAQIFAVYITYARYTQITLYKYIIYIILCALHRCEKPQIQNPTKVPPSVYYILYRYSHCFTDIVSLFFFTFTKALL